MKYVLIALVVAGVAWWWLERRRKAVRARMAEQPGAMKQLTACPKCGVYAAKGEHTCV